MKITVHQISIGHFVPVNGKIHNPKFQAMLLDAEGKLKSSHPYYRLLRGDFSAEVSREIDRRLRQGFGEEQAYRA